MQVSATLLFAPVPNSNSVRATGQLTIGIKIAVLFAGTNRGSPVPSLSIFREVALRREDLLKPDLMSEVILLGAGALVFLISDSDPCCSSDSSLCAGLKPKARLLYDQLAISWHPRACKCAQRIGPGDSLAHRRPLQRAHRNLELAVAKGARSRRQGRCLAIDHHKIALGMANPLLGRLAGFFAHRFVLSFSFLSMRSHELLNLAISRGSEDAPVPSAYGTVSHRQETVEVKIRRKSKATG